MREEREIRVPEYALSFRLEPHFLAKSGDSQEVLIYLNAQDPSLYQSEENCLRMIREFGYEKPRLRVWIISSGSALNYTVKRIIEEGWRAGVLVTTKMTGLFSFLADSNSSPFESQVEYDGNLVELPNVVITRLGAKVTYKELALLRYLESFEKCIVLNSSPGMDLSRDKLVTMQTLAKHKISIPKTVMATFPLTNIEWIEQKLGGYPMILKKTNGSRGNGIILIKDRNQIIELNDVVNPANNWILQEFISKSRGRDVRVIVMGDRVIGSMMRIAVGESFKSNFHQGGICEAHPLDSELEGLSRLTSQICCLNISGVDVLLDGSEYKICEINSSPGCEGFELAHSGSINIGRETVEYCLRVFHQKNIQTN